MTKDNCFTITKHLIFIHPNKYPSTVEKIDLTDEECNITKRLIDWYLAKNNDEISETIKKANDEKFAKINEAIERL